MTSLASPAFRRLALLCCSFVFLALAGVARADDAPTFSDADVTAFAKDYSAFIDQYVVIMKDYMAAAKTSDTARMEAAGKKAQEFMPKITDLQTKAAQMQSKVKPEEAQKFADYMQACVKKMTDALQ